MERKIEVGIEEVEKWKRVYFLYDDCDDNCCVSFEEATVAIIIHLHNSNKKLYLSDAPMQLQSNDIIKESILINRKDALNILRTFQNNYMEIFVNP